MDNIKLYHKSPEKSIEEPFDLVIIGGGVAGLTAAIYSARTNLKTIVYEQSLVGGIVATVPNFENFPSFLGDGAILARQIKDQALKSGAVIKYGNCQNITKKGSLFHLNIDGQTVLSKTVLVTTGSNPRKLTNFDTNKPIHYCATCDGPLYKDQDVLVLGGGNSAVSESLFLARLVKNLTLVSKTKISAEKTIFNRLKQQKNVKIYEEVDPTPNMASDVSAVFVLIGRIPATNFLDQSLLDEYGYIKTDSENMTKIPGLFAAGDVRANIKKQAIIAAGDGASAAIAIEQYLNKENL